MYLFFYLTFLLLLLKLTKSFASAIKLGKTKVETHKEAQTNYGTRVDFSEASTVFTLHFQHQNPLKDLFFNYFYSIPSKPGNQVNAPFLPKK